MSDNRFLRSQRPPLLAPVRRLTQGSRPVLLAAILGLSSALAVGAPLALAAPIADASPGASSALAIIQPNPQLLDDSPDTFTMGVLTDGDGQKIHVRLPNGDISAFRVDSNTVIRDENGNRKSQDDLREGEIVIVTTDGDNDDTADLIVDGGFNGFQQGGAFDVGNRMDDRGRWDWRARSNEAPPFDPRAMGAIFRGLHRAGPFNGPGLRDHREGDTGGGITTTNTRRFFWNRSR